MVSDGGGRGQMQRVRQPVDLHDLGLSDDPALSGFAARKPLDHDLTSQAIDCDLAERGTEGTILGLNSIRR